MQNKYQIIFVDLDWTLLNHRTHDFDYESIKALNKAHDRGISVFICTARPYQSLELTGILNHLKVDGLVTTNGAVVIFNDQVIYSKNFKKEDLLKIIEVSHKHGFTLELASEKDRFFTKSGDNEYVESFFKIFAEKKPEIRNYTDENISEVLLFSPEEYDSILLKEYPKGINIYRFFPSASDLNYSPTNKDEGIKKALKYLKISKRKAIGIGDDIGDIPMFKAVNLSIAMGNAKEKAKKKAKFTTKNIDESGVKYALEYFKII